MLIPVDIETDFPQWVAGNESVLEADKLLELSD